jgi:hypothetical protein
MTVLDLTEKVTYSQPSTGHGFFQCSKATANHLDYTKQRLAKQHPSARLIIIQGCYHDDVDVSAGTHDKDRCLDVMIVGLTWSAAQRFLRSCGWAAWWRKPSQGPWSDHIHMCSLVHPHLAIPVGVFVPGQIEDYYLHAFGLAGMHNVDLDKSWFPGDEGRPPWPVGTPAQWRADIDKTLDDFYAWEKELEDDMPSPVDWTKDDWNAVRANLVPQIATAVWMWDGFNKDKAKALLLLASGK